MKVICIDAGKSIKYPNLIIPLIEGKEYEAFECKYPESYIIGGLEHDANNNLNLFFLKKRFAPISEIDEKEFERNYEKELV